MKNRDIPRTFTTGMERWFRDLERLRVKSLLASLPAD